MNTIRLKICGMRQPQNIREVALLQPDYMGFIFYADSPRFVGKDFTVPDDFPSTIKKVGVFVNASSEEIVQQAQAHQLAYVQLHGHETVAQCENLKSHGYQVIKAFSVDGAFDFKLTAPYQPYVDYFLFDTKGKYYGGNAQVFDWRLLEKYNQQKPFFLSGGISMEQLHALKAIRNMNIHAVDVNSGVESAPAVKDVTKVNELKQVLNAQML